MKRKERNITTETPGCPLCGRTNTAWRFSKKVGEHKNMEGKDCLGAGLYEPISIREKIPVLKDGGLALLWRRNCRQ
ncbi:hypothetical protein KKD37_03775 [Patescibacteria group bacterium]|nr:hypothetical protein [Patescibacteria group bacterium]